MLNNSSLQLRQTQLHSHTHTFRWAIYSKQFTPNPADAPEQFVNHDTMGIDDVGGKNYNCADCAKQRKPTVLRRLLRSWIHLRLRRR